MIEKDLVKENENLKKQIETLKAKMKRRALAENTLRSAIMWGHDDWIKKIISRLGELQDRIIACEIAWKIKMDVPHD